MQAKAPTERDVEALLCGFETTSNRSWLNGSVDAKNHTRFRGHFFVRLRIFQRIEKSYLKQSFEKGR